MKTFFGFKEVNAADKANMVGQVFSNVASKYDIMNDLMSFGVHRMWKNIMLDELSPRSGTKLLDVAGGTGDIAFRFLNKISNADVTICDINKEMLKEGKARAIDRGILSNINWLCGDAEKLPVEDNSFDYYTIAFGIRNVTNIQKALEEAFRVLKPGGRFLCMEFSHVENEMLRSCYDAFSFNVIPKIGKVIAKDEASYQYLVESIRKFPQQEEFKKMIELAGFENVKYKNLSGGIVALNSGWKI